MYSFDLDIIRQYVTSEFLNNLDCILKKFEDEEFDPAELITMEFYPNLYDAEDAEIKIRSEQTITVKTTTIYTCPKCKKRETVARQIYTAMKADEQTKHKITCVDCGKVWIK
jgi:DNA-directed RNA polymerase subunit M/transcription elongation factor TFIIS